MATQRMIARGKACEKLAKSRSAIRKVLQKTIKDPKVGFEEKMQAVWKLNKEPRDASPARHNTRCELCGRVHAVYKKFRLCRLCLRKCVMFGLVPGMRKASW